MIVSKAELKSTRSKIVPCFLSIAVSTELVTYYTAAQFLSNGFSNRPTESTQPCADQTHA